MKTIHALVIAIIGASLTSVTIAGASDTDDRIETSTKKTYVFRTELKGDSSRIQSQDGVVTLTGTVADESHKSLAEDTVKGLPGVQGVDNRLEVKRPSATEGSDAWIGTKVKFSLLLHRSVSGKTQVDVKDGVVTLRGRANSKAEKDLATEYAQDVDGVKRVDNKMTVAANPREPTVGEQIDDASITAHVKFALLQHRSTSALRTKVETNSGVVTLEGIARNQAEIDLVTKLVRDIEGVKDVKNQMTIQN